MKKYRIFAAAILFLCFLVVPLAALEPAVAEEPILPTAAPEKSPPPAIKVLRSATGKTEELAAREYIFGVVAAEMSMSNHDEALKAQAVAAYTYALCKAEQAGSDDFALSDDPSVHQAYISRAEAMEKWGERAEEYAARLDSITKSVEGQAVYYQGHPILAAYHHLSCGRTLPAAHVWGKDYPYLISVESAGDLLSPSYKKETTISQEKFAEICQKNGITLSGEPAEWIKSAENDKYGCVDTITICQSTISGADARKIFGLRSTAFEAKWADGIGFTFSVRGYGHGVGLSQTGANYMALCGSNYTEILGWYYPGTKLVQQ